MDFHDPKVFGDTFIFDGLVYLSSVFQKQTQLKYHKKIREILW